MSTAYILEKEAIVQADCGKLIPEATKAFEGNDYDTAKKIAFQVITEPFASDSQKEKCRHIRDACVLEK
ncbi:MAG: hypothetical protein DHS20C02_00440 [Micavibrio sp.]|nr:MAG: hypothetical protein DHS20C02_00440 [Micavibrio sp.]